MKKPIVAFICVHNSCRSQIAEALGKHLAADVFDSYSAGTESKPEINQDAVRIMKQLYDIDMNRTQYSKLLSDIPDPDIAISMGCNVGCPFIGRAFDDNWGLPDPTGQSDEEFKAVIKQIETKILQLKNMILFEYEITEDQCKITKYLGEDKQACEIPDEIEGCAVTSIAKYAFSEHRELLSVSLPKQLNDIGAHAFYNCRNLRHITLYDGLRDMGDGAFKNCDKVSEIEIIRDSGSMKCLKALMEEMNQEMRVTIHYGEETSVLVFPYYLYEYEENTPGRIINQVTIGSGVHYRECIGGEDINYVQYDRIFDVEKNIDVNESAWKVAYWRLRFPYALSDKDAQSYGRYLSERKYDIAEVLIKKEMYDELVMFLDMMAETRDDVETIIEGARSNNRIKAVGILLEYEKKRWQAKKKSYDFE